MFGSLIPDKSAVEDLGCRKRTAGAEARLVFMELNGTTEVVPFPEPDWSGVFQQAEVVPFPGPDRSGVFQQAEVVPFPGPDWSGVFSRLKSCPSRSPTGAEFFSRLKSCPFLFQARADLFRSACEVVPFLKAFLKGVLQRSD